MSFELDTQELLLKFIGDFTLPSLCFFNCFNIGSAVDLQLIGSNMISQSYLLIKILKLEWLDMYI